MLPKRTDADGSRSNLFLSFFYKDMHISGKPVFLQPVEEESVESVSFAKVTSQTHSVCAPVFYPILKRCFCNNYN